MQYGRHNYVNRLIQLDEENKSIANVSWSMIGFFANKPSNHEDGNEDENKDEADKGKIKISQNNL